MRLVHKNIAKNMARYCNPYKGPLFVTDLSKKTFAIDQNKILPFIIEQHKKLPNNEQELKPPKKQENESNQPAAMEAKGTILENFNSLIFAAASNTKDKEYIAENIRFLIDNALKILIAVKEKLPDSSNYTREVAISILKITAFLFNDQYKEQSDTEIKKIEQNLQHIKKIVVANPEVKEFITTQMEDLTQNTLISLIELIRNYSNMRSQAKELINSIANNKIFDTEIKSSFEEILKIAEEAQKNFIGEFNDANSEL
jgi:hypothetical protein